LSQGLLGFGSSLLSLALFLSFIAARPAAAQIVIFAGVNNTAGAVQIVGSTTTCATGSHKLQWNQTGRAGPKGATGATGPAGVKGATGPAGAIGPKGATGRRVPLGDGSARAEG
jgi:hypothetical protein